MKVLTKNTDYAVRALMSLGEHKNGFISSRVISDEQAIPYQYLRKILQVLIKEKLVLSKEGGGGGYKLGHAAGKIKISDIIKVFQGNIELSECMFRKKVCCNRDKCVLRKSIVKIEAIVIKEFDKITIGSLLKEMNKK